MINGKVDRQKLLSIFSSMSIESPSDHDDLSPIEGVLLKTVISVIGNKGSTRPVRLTDNFFEIGGNSLNALDVVLQLKEQGYILGI